MDSNAARLKYKRIRWSNSGGCSGGRNNNRISFVKRDLARICLENCLMITSLEFRRPDGSYVATVNQLPYHVLQEDPLYADAQAWVAEHGDPPFEPLPPVLPLPVRTRIFKADIWRRATDAEAVTIDAALQAQPVRLRRLWDDAQWLETTDELYPSLQAAFVAAFGAARAAELLEPSA